MSGPIQQIDTPPPDSHELPMAQPRGFWAEAWLRFRRRPRSMAALIFVIFLALVALFAPAIAGTKPIVCRYKGHIYFPALGYFNSDWENAVFQRDGFRKRYPEPLREKIPRVGRFGPWYSKIRIDAWKRTSGQIGPRIQSMTKAPQPPELVRHDGERLRRVRHDGPRHHDRAAGRLCLNGHCRIDRCRAGWRWPATFEDGWIC